MLIDYKSLDNIGHHSLATKVSAGGFAIARLEINTADGALQARK
jgi:hypothetical protein